MGVCISTTNFNPRSPWGERPFGRISAVHKLGISIHAPRGGSDFLCYNMAIKVKISIHAPRGGSDFESITIILGIHISIHAPRGGSDLGAAAPLTDQADFNPRSPWGERPCRLGLWTEPVLISIHAPRGGSDSISTTLFLPILAFQSTLPVGGATRKPIPGRRLDKDFNPRSPWGERQQRCTVLPANLWRKGKF